MGLGTGNTHLIGYMQKFYVTKEAMPGRYAEPVTGDSMDVVDTDFVPDRPRTPIMTSYLATRDVTEQFTLKDNYAWTVNARYVPSGTKSIAPDCGPFLEALMGTETPGANDVTYSQNSSQALTTLTLTRHWQEKYMAAMSGCVVEEMTFKADGTTEPRISFSGFAMDAAFTAATAVQDDPLAAAAATLNVPAGEGVNIHDPQDCTLTAGAYAGIYALSAIEIGTSAPTAAITAYADYGDATHVTVTSNGHTLAPGQMVTIAGSTNYNGVFRVGGTLGITTTNTFLIEDTWVADDAAGAWTAQCHLVSDRTTDAITLCGAVSAQQAQAVVVHPYVPTHTSVGSPITGIIGAFSWDSYTSFAIKDFELTYKNNHKICNDHAFKPHTDDAIPLIRDINCKFTARLRHDYLDYLLKRQDFPKDALTVTIGGAAQSGTRVVISAPYGEIKYNNISAPESEECEVIFDIKLLGSSGNDALTIVHT